MTLDVNILWDYPTSPPKLTFSSHIFHPHLYVNANVTGCQPAQRWHNQVRLPPGPLRC